MPATIVNIMLEKLEIIKFWLRASLLARFLQLIDVTQSGVASMKGSWRVGRICGIVIAIHYSWFVIFGGILVTLAKMYFPNYHPDWSETTYWLVGTATATLFFASVLLHELAHSLVAIRLGIPVRDITLFILGGVANIRKEADSPTTELAVAAAGPAASVGLAVLFGGTWYFSAGFSEQIAALSFYLATTNGMLALFNVIPGLPLDGGRLLRATLWRLSDDFRRATRVASTSGRVIGYLFILTGVGAALIGSWLNGIWLIVIGWFLQNAAESSYQNSLAYSLLKDVSVKEVMTTDCPTVEEYLSVKELVESYVSKYNMVAFPVVHGRRLVGMVTLDSLREVPQQDWEQTFVAEVMTGIENIKTIHPSERADQALEEMGEREISQVPVVDGGRIIGLLSRSGVLQFLKSKERLSA
ncbi:MAG: site-2 protease family protein [Chloroflexi bacterium]|nr:site-2 protease family protein [Chloroflexota bacterium]